MKYRHLTMQDYQKMPWKNGLGSTLQLCIYPEYASVQTNDFGWRISSAKVPRQSAFSLFPKHERFLMLVEGEEIILSQNKATMSLRHGEVIQFPGSSATHCVTSQEHTRDLNVFVDLNRFYADVQIFTGKQLHLLSSHAKNFVIALSDSTTLSFQDGTQLQLKQLECFQFWEVAENTPLSTAEKDLYALIKFTEKTD